MEFNKNVINKENTQKTINALDNAIKALEKKYKNSDTEDIRELINLMFKLIKVS